MREEIKEIKRLISDNIKRPKLYISSGQFLPVQLEKEERDLLIKNLQNYLEISKTEIQRADSEYQKYANGERSEVLKNIGVELSRLAEVFA